MNPLGLSDLVKLLDFGAKCFKHQNLNVLKMRGAKKVLFPCSWLRIKLHRRGLFSLSRKSLCLESVVEKIFCRFSGSFEPIFDPKSRGYINIAYITPAFWIENRPK